MIKFIPYTVIAVLIVGAVLVVSGKLKSESQNETATTTEQQEEVTGDAGPSAVPVSQINLDTKGSVNTAIDAELKQLEQELQGVSGADFDSSGLTDTQLGL
jgi:uncharacterized protein HemX